MSEKYPKETYIDAEGVRRGWYVYLHRDIDTNEVFYIGMGIARRAWDKERRNDLWKAKVANLPDGYSIEILEDDLSEIEAEDLEKSSVEKYGGVDEGSPLTNKVAGGRLEIAVSLESIVGLPTEKAFREIETMLSLDGVEYSSNVKQLLEALTVFFEPPVDEKLTRKTMGILIELVEEHGPEIMEQMCGGYEAEQFEFISGSRDQQTHLLSEFEKEHSGLMRRVFEIENELADSEISTVSAVGCGIEVEMSTIERAIGDHKRRRISWEKFCETFSDCYQMLRYDIKEMHDELEELDERLDSKYNVINEVLTAYAGLHNKITR